MRKSFFFIFTYHFLSVECPVIQMEGQVSTSPSFTDPKDFSPSKSRPRINSIHESEWELINDITVSCAFFSRNPSVLFLPLNT